MHPLRKITRITPKSPFARMAAAVGLLLAAAVLIATFALHRSSQSDSSIPILQTDDGKKAEDLLRLSEETYSAVLLSMHSTANFREEDFLHYRGLDTLVAA
ncbi:MAG TPA: hypothetical protein DCZ91_25305, partial [Lachnospiraceae bacterium]|nr:hypothetical protein [Lachnospiraceae bacterium]